MTALLALPPDHRHRVQLAMQEAERMRLALLMEIEHGSGDPERVRRLLGNVAVAFLDAAHEIGKVAP